MKERPILFSGEMVRAILDGRKTQTRRVIKPQPNHNVIFATPETTFGCDQPMWLDADCVREGREIKCPYGTVGDRLWVRETFTLTQHGDPVYRADARDRSGTRWTSITPGDPNKEVLWKPSIFMPRAASRLTLEITNIRVERLQEISEEDAIAEGLEEWEGMWGWSEDKRARWSRCPIAAYRMLWESINGPGSWEANPWVWVIEFKSI